MKRREMAKSSESRVLVVDANKCYASIVKEQLAESIGDVDVDVAVNIWEMKRKLSAYSYRFIIADVSCSNDEREMTRALSASATPVYYWSSAKDDFGDKPMEVDDIKKVVAKISTFG